MPDPLTTHYPVPTVPAEHDGVTIALAAPMARFSLRSRSPEGLPARITATASFGAGKALCLGPDEWMLMLPQGAVPPAIDGLHSLTDVSHRAIALTLAGARAAALLQTGCPLDLDLAHFPPGKATRTIHDGVEIILWRTADDQFHVEVWRSFAPYLWASLNLMAGC